MSFICTLLSLISFVLIAFDESSPVELECDPKPKKKQTKNCAINKLRLNLDFERLIHRHWFYFWNLSIPESSFKSKNVLIGQFILIFVDLS